MLLRKKHKNKPTSSSNLVLPEPHHFEHRPLATTNVGLPCVILICPVSAFFWALMSVDMLSWILAISSQHQVMNAINCKHPGTIAKATLCLTIMEVDKGVPKRKPVFQHFPIVSSRCWKKGTCLLQLLVLRQGFLSSLFVTSKSGSFNRHHK